MDLEKIRELLKIVAESGLAEVEMEIGEDQVKLVDPGLKGDTATGATKPATLESGAVVHVPLFVDEGDVIRVNTDTGDYITRVST